MKGKHVIGAALALSLCVSVAGCGPQKQQSVGSGLGEVTTTGEYPMDTDVTLRYWVGLNSDLTTTNTSMNTTPFKEYLEEATGVKIQFEHPVIGQEGEAFNILISSEDMPDIVEYSWQNYPNGPQTAIDDGIIEPLNEYFEKVSPNVKKQLDKDPALAVQMMTDEGSYYAYPFFRDGEELLSFMTYGVRQDLLDQAGLPIPETFDEWQTMLYKFKDMGVKIPLSLRINNANLERFSPFTGIFGFIGTFYHDKDNKVKFGPYEPAFADYVKQLKQWYDDGILDPEFVDTAGKRISSNISNGEVGAFFSTIGGEMGSYLAAITPESGIKLTSTKVPVVNKGDTPMFCQKDWPLKPAAAISATSKHKEIAARFLDYGYSEKGHLLYNFGKEGVSYTMVNNEPIYTPRVVDHEQNGGLSVAQGMAQYSRAYYSGPFVQDKGYIQQYYQTDVQKEALLNTASDALEYQLPTIYMTGEEQKRFTDIMTPINTYREETLAKLVAGKMDISKLDEYFSELERLGIEEAITRSRRPMTGILKKWKK